MSALTAEQEEILRFVRTGHNALIHKSTVVTSIRQDCKRRNLKVEVVCSSGIACCVYETGIASTLHSFYGIGAADMPAEDLIMARAVGDSRICKRIKGVDVLIWDEACMSSARIFELVNALHHLLAAEESGPERYPFAGKQIITVGEFLQLRPLPSCFDSGQFMFKSSRVFAHAISQGFELTKVLRQSETSKNCL